MLISLTLFIMTQNRYLYSFSYLEENRYYKFHMRWQLLPYLLYQTRRRPFWPTYIYGQIVNVYCKSSHFILGSKMFFGLTLKTYPQIHGNKSLYRCKTPVIQYMQNDSVFVCDFCFQSKYSQICIKRSLLGPRNMAL